MDIRKILAELRTGRDRLDQAIAAVESLNFAGQRLGRRGRRPAPLQATPARPLRRRRLSAAARKKLSAMMKAGWASGKMGRKKAKVA